MSRIGKKPILIPDKVQLSLAGSQITVQGEKGKLTHSLHPSVELRVDGGVVTIIKKEEGKKNGRSPRVDTKSGCQYGNGCPRRVSTESGGKRDRISRFSQWQCIGDESWLFSSGQL